MKINHNIKKPIFEYARKRPSKTAIIFGEQTMLYSEFDKSIKKLSQKLQTEGVIKGSIVAICVPNSLEMLISIYAVLYLRAIVLPINIDLPIERVRTIFSDSQPSMALCKKELENEIIHLNVKSIFVDSTSFHTSVEENPFQEINITENDDAFCIYTSGSTGIPKGVLLSWEC